MLAKCSLPGRHTPIPLSSEAHHLVPVAWQLFWQPAIPPFPGRDPDGRGLLWDCRTVVLCPTHHRSVHVLIVELMHTVWQTKLDVVPQIKVARNHAGELGLAALGLQRVLDVGGSLVALAAGGEWGEA